MAVAYARGAASLSRYALTKDDDEMMRNVRQMNVQHEWALLFVL